MGEIAADAAGIVVNVEGGFERISEVITKGDVIVDPIANGLNPWPPKRGRTKKLPGDIGELVDFAITARQKERKRIARQILDLVLRRIRMLFIGLALVLDQCIE